MLSKWTKVSAAAIVGGVLGFAGMASAAPRELTGIDGDGHTVSSGWTWDVPASLEPMVNLVFIRAEDGNFFFEKDAEITRVSDPIVITFHRISDDAKTLIINDEAVENHTGTDWGAFRMELSSGSVGGVPNFAFMTSNGAPGLGDFSIDPYTNFTFYNQNAGLLFNGGVVHAGDTWYPGSQSDTGLALVAGNTTASTFTLKEIPVAIPLPAAAWTGLSTMLGVALIGARKRVRGLLA